MSVPSSYRDARVLVTGGAGFVGSNLTRALLAAPVRSVHIIDNLLSSERSALPEDPRMTVVEGSVADPEIVSLVTDDYDVVFHLSTFHGNQNSIHDPLADHEHNQLTTLRLFDRLKDLGGLTRVVYAAAGCAVADKTNAVARATTEDGPISLRMDSPYSISKIVGELYAVYYHHQHGLPAVRARFQNVYGPWEILGAGRWRGTPATIWRNVIPTFVYKALAREALPLEGAGEATRDFIYVDDIVRGLLLCGSAGVPGDVYNLASGLETSIADLACLVNELTANPTPVEVRPARVWDRSGHRFGSTVKAREHLGFAAQVPLREGLARTIEWTRAHRALITACIQRHAAHLEPTRA